MKTIIAVWFLLLSLALSGCVTRGYKLADETVPPAVALNLTSAATTNESSTPAAEVSPPIDAVVHSVIVYQGPGSWKREAYWDEYVIALTNRSATPVEITSAALHSMLAQPTSLGDNPWTMERAGKTWWDSNAGQQTKTYLLLGTGTLGAAGVTIGAALSGGFLAPMSAAASAGVAVGTATVVALPLVAVGSVAMNMHRKHQIEAEFTRRRMVLPLTLAPGETKEGSFFFGITPMPQKLVLGARTATAPLDITIGLSPIAGLHVKPDAPILAQTNVAAAAP